MTRGWLPQRAGSPSPERRWGCRRGTPAAWWDVRRLRHRLKYQNKRRLNFILWLRVILNVQIQTYQGQTLRMNYYGSGLSVDNGQSQGWYEPAEWICMVTPCRTHQPSEQAASRSSHLYHMFLTTIAVTTTTNLLFHRKTFVLSITSARLRSLSNAYT